MIDELTKRESNILQIQCDYLNEKIFNCLKKENEHRKRNLNLDELKYKEIILFIR